MNRRFVTIAGLVLTAILQWGAVHAGDNQVFISRHERVPLIELYTSEGCSSCPPADRWLSALRDESGLWRDFVPIALHVDYWDYIGWRDRFAHADFSRRQKTHVAEGGARFAYTPGFFVDGAEWRGAGLHELPTSGIDAGILSARVDGDTVAVRFSPADASHSPDQSSLVVHVAILGMDLTTRVRAGENAGRELRHDFVALGVASAPLERRDEQHRAVLSLPAASQPADRTALVVWVSRIDRQVPLQSVGGFLN